VVAGATVAWPLHQRLLCNCRLRPRYTTECWRGPLSPSPDRPTYQPMEPSDPHDSPWSHRVMSCVVHGWVCPNQVAPAQGASSSGIQGEEEGREEDEDDSRQISMVAGHVGPLVIHLTARISIGPRGRPQGLLAPWTATTLPSSSTPSLTVPRPPPVLPSSEDDPSGSGSPPVLLSPCNNRLLRLFAHLAAPSDKG
jgi:hypothetical protein